ncbi:MAG: aminotransferase class V-fold PLP-dependent enzyme [Steroidobacteraceae bacterium]
MRLPVYLDHAATTPVDPAVAEAMMQCLASQESFANPSSDHRAGRAAAVLVERARAQVAALLGAEPDEIIFTSGATESTNLAVLGSARANADRGRHIVTSRIEHKAVLDPCRQLEKEGFRVTYLAPDRSGLISPAALAAALRPDTILATLMHVNNETGVIGDIAAFASVCRSRGVTFHTDAAQSVGHIATDVRELAVDLLSLTAHKLHGPKGIGALYVRRGVRGRLAPLGFGGSQEGGLRPGTLPTHQIVGFGVAVEQAARLRASEFVRLAGLRDRLWGGLEALPGIHLNGASAPRVPHILSVSVEAVDGESLVAGLGTLAISRGAACNSASGEPSYVLRALGRSTRLAESSLRFSLGRRTTSQEIEHAIDEVRREVTRLRHASPGGGALPPGGISLAGGTSPGGGAEPAGLAGSLDPGGTEVDRLFAALPGCGTLPDCAGTVLHGEGGGPDREAWVRFHLLVENDIVKDARFEARGCPHTLATAAWLAREVRGRRCEDLPGAGPEAWARTLEVPVEKLGRLFAIEDALVAALRSGASASHRSGPRRVREEDHGHLSD